MKHLSVKDTFELLKMALSNSQEIDLKKLPREELMNIICSGCPFFSEDKERLECGAFRIVAALIEKGLLDGNILRALAEDKTCND